MSGTDSSVREITGRTRKECEDRLYKQYGANFQIIETKTLLSGGFMGFFQREMVSMRYQLTTSMPERESIQPRAPISPKATPTPRPVYQSYTPTPQIQTTQPQVTQPHVAKQTSFLQNRDEILSKIGAAQSNAGGLTAIAKQLDQFKMEMQKQMQAVAQAASAEKEHPGIVKLRQMLEENEFTKTYVDDLCAKMKDSLTVSQLDDFDLVQRQAVDWIAQSVPIAPKEKNRIPRVIVLIGPTGVGKTTTIAKMAASIFRDYSKNRENYQYKPRIRMITTDTMRVKALEQLSGWADFMNLDVDQAQNVDDLKELYERYAANSDYIFIDSAGYSPNDSEHIGKMRAVFNVKNMNESIYLTFAAGTGARDLENILRNYDVFGYKSVIVTKCDETTSFGRLISVLSQKDKKISWITTGQDVLGTMQKASAAWFLRNLSEFKVDSGMIEKKFGIADKELGSLF